MKGTLLVKEVRIYDGGDEMEFNGCTLNSSSLQVDTCGKIHNIKFATQEDIDKSVYNNIIKINKSRDKTKSIKIVIIMTPDNKYLTGLIDDDDYVFTTQDYNSFINNK